MKRVLIATAIATGLLAANVAHAEGFYMGQIIMMSSSYCPVGTLVADGSILTMNNNTNNKQALAAIMGNNYGGDFKQNNFALPNLQGGLTVGGKTVPVTFCIVTEGAWPQRP